MLNFPRTLKAWTSAVLMAVPLWCAAQAHSDAAGFPSSTVTLVASSGAGGGIDITARLIAQQLGEQLGQQVIIENRPGASGSIAGTYVLNGPANGYRLLFTASNMVQTAAQSQKPPYALSDFAAVSRIGATNLILVVNPNLVKATTIDELIAEIKAQPGEFSYGSYGNGTTAHICGEILKRSTGVTLVHVPYKGVSPMVNGVVGGEVAIAFTDIGTAMPFLKSKRMRALAITGTERFQDLPDTPTFKERGISGLELTGWYGVFAPAKTPQPVIERLSKALNTVLKNPSIQRTLIDRGVVPQGGSAEQFGRDVLAEEKEWTRVIRENDIRGD